jgi:hypothetical protein
MSALKTNQLLELGGYRQETAEAAISKMSRGFCLKSELTPAQLGYVFGNYPDAATIKIASAGLHGGRHYSIHDLIGHSVSGMVYVVTNHQSFTNTMASKLELDFTTKNPAPSSRIRASFTSFMHENKLHWSRCCGNNTILQNKSIRDKLTTLSNKTGKTSTEIISDLLDSALAYHN